MIKNEDKELEKERKNPYVVRKHIKTCPVSDEILVRLFGENLSNLLKIFLCFLATILLLV
jgi:hypothetical protein